MPEFTRSEADMLLPKLRPLLEDLRRRMESYRRRPSDPLVREVEALLREIAEMGVEVKDPDQGLVDFRGRYRGREVYLCWKLGEGDRVAFWHELEAGFAGRKIIED
jgi:hypothetical protein